jgi:hypothetical protein
MKQLFAALIGVAIVSTAISSPITPAFALGGCGPNHLRDGWGHCAFGGQNQSFCLRRTGHTATRMSDEPMQRL